jgi:hypothetical protein
MIRGETDFTSNLCIEESQYIFIEVNSLLLRISSSRENSGEQFGDGPVGQKRIYVQSLKLMVVSDFVWSVVLVFTIRPSLVLLYFQGFVWLS